MRLRPHPARSRRADRLRIFDPGCRLRVNATLRRRANHAFPKPDNRANCCRDAFAFALSIQGRKRVHNADELRAEIVAKRVCQTSST
jgi:hypothetical protein